MTTAAAAPTAPAPTAATQPADAAAPTAPAAAAAPANALNWFEIPVVDMARARRFYGAVLQAELPQDTIAGVAYAVFPYTPPAGVGGALVSHPRYSPSRQGSVIYLPAGDDLDGMLERVAAAGGEVVGGKLRLSDAIGTIAFFDDPEGNRIGLHSRR